jgi:hypothetical protein
MGADLKDEIAGIKRELDLLGARYRLMQRWAMAAKYAAWVLLLALIVAEAAAIITGNVVAGAAASFFIIIYLLAFILFYGTEIRWIDVISPVPGYTMWQFRQSEARAIERMIAEREAKLSTLNP